MLGWSHSGTCLGNNGFMHLRFLHLMVHVILQQKFLKNMFLNKMQILKDLGKVKSGGL